MKYPNNIQYHNDPTKYTCEAEYQYQGDTTEKLYKCGNHAEYFCIYCNKRFCVDDIYLVCEVCHISFGCFQCGYPKKYEDGELFKYAKQYCRNCDPKSK